MRSSIPDIRVRPQKVLERREPLAATRVVTDADQSVVLDATRANAVARRETFVDRLASGLFNHETSHEVLRTIGLWTDRAARVSEADDSRATVAALEEARGVAGRLDAIRPFHHLYVEVFLMRVLMLELADHDATKAAYRDLIALHADHPLGQPETLRGVAWARGAIERLVPVPSGTVNQEEVGMTPADAERLG